MTKFFPFLTRQVRIRSSAAIAVLGLIVASSAGAVPFLQANSGEGGAGGTELQPCFPAGGSFTSTGAPVSSHAVCGPTDFGTGSGLAIALIGNLGAEARGQHFGNGTSIFMASGARYSDTVVFSGPGDAPVPVGMNLHFGGTLNSDIGGFADVTVRAFINGSTVGRDDVRVENGVPTCPDLFPNIHFSGLGPCVLTYNLTLQSSLIFVPQDVPINFELDLDVTAGGGGNGSSGTSLFSNTFGFVTSGPVFDLPEGFTANSPTSFIVNNRFLPAGPVAAVPEPSSMLLVISALGLLGMLRRRRA